MKRKVIYLFMILALMLSVTPAAFAQDGTLPDRFDGREASGSIADLKLDEPVSMDSSLDASLLGASGPTRVSVRLHADSIAERNIKGRSAQRMGLILDLYQDRVLERILEIDPTAHVIAQTHIVLNAVYVSADGAKLGEIAALPGVARVAPVVDYELDLSETVPYIGASTVQAAGFDGTGIRVAVLDSGIDYLHANLGGSGDPDEFAANDPTIIEEGTFPTAKVVGGYDFVGSDWPNLPEDPDPDPLDDGPEGGHGTHVADIIGGMDGVAPGVDLYAVKVCSSVSTACSGIALIQGMEFAVDPNGDGDPSDAVDVINMSLGANYGNPFYDDLSFAVDNATALGVLTVSSAGNGSNKPFITGTPSSAITALAVAQTQVPSAFQPFLTVTAPEAYVGDYVAVFQPWSVYPTETITAAMQYGDGAGVNVLGCDPFEPGSLADKIVLVDRGGCNFTLKIKNIGDAGGVAGIIGLVAPGDPFSGGDGGDRPIDIPGYMVSQAVSNVFKAAIATGESMMEIDPTRGLPLVGSMVGSSSRGPANNDFNLLKPEIGAPGASVSAIAGSGTDTGPFGGTSGASPMVAGSAALLLDAYPDLIPAEVKARLMNTGETQIYTDMLSMQLAPISRIGGGEVRVDRALAAPAAAWDDELLLGSLSFGFLDVDKTTVNLFKTVRVRNYSDKDIWYDVSTSFRMEDDALSGAVEIEAPKQVYVKAGRDATFNVKLTIHGELLYGNYMNSGSLGASAVELDINEFDGYLTLDDGGDYPIHMAWHVLPRQAAHTLVRPEFLKFDPSGVAMLNVVNRGVGMSQIDQYSLLGVSDNLPTGGPGSQMPVPDLRAVGVQTYPVPAGFCSAEPSFLWAFAINSWERQQHLVAPEAYYSVFVDVDKDGAADYEIFNFDLSLSSGLSDGRVVTWVADVETGAATAFFFAEHATNTANTVLLVCGEQLGLTGTDMLNTFVDVTFQAYDWYFGNGVTDEIGGITITPLGERYFGLFEDVPGKSKTFTYVADFGKGFNEDLGLLLFTNGDRGAGMRGGATADTEAIIVMPQTPAPKPKP